MQIKEIINNDSQEIQLLKIIQDCLYFHDQIQTFY